MQGAYSNRVPNPSLAAPRNDENETGKAPMYLFGAPVVRSRLHIHRIIVGEIDAVKGHGEVSMAISGSLNIINVTGGPIVVTEVIPVNHDPEFSIPRTGTIIEHGDCVVILMSNDSPPISPRGIGCSFYFMNSQFQIGNVYLEIPAVGPHQLNGANPPGQVVYDYTFSNPGGEDSYAAIIGLA